MQNRFSQPVNSIEPKISEIGEQFLKKTFKKQSKKIKLTFPRVITFGVRKIW